MNLAFFSKNTKRIPRLNDIVLVIKEPFSWHELYSIVYTKGEFAIMRHVNNKDMYRVRFADLEFYKTGKSSSFLCYWTVKDSARSVETVQEDWYTYNYL